MYWIVLYVEQEYKNDLSHFPEYLFDRTLASHNYMEKNTWSKSVDTI